MAQNLNKVTRGKQTPTKLELSYLAGVIDADGSICISKMTKEKLASGARIKNPRYVLYVNVVNTSEDLMLWLVDTFGGRYKRRRMKDPKKQRQTFDWRYDNGKALWLLKAVEPFLIIKKSRARIGIQLLENWVTKHGRGAMTPPEEVARRETLYQAMTKENQQGVVQPQRLSVPAPAVQQGDAIV